MKREFFRPLEGKWRPPVESVIVTFEGPNGVGKTSIFRQSLTIVQTLEGLIYPEDRPCPPIVGVVEPPVIEVDPADRSRKDTWRILAKEGRSVDGLVDEELLRQPLFQAGLFLWGRRFVENKLVGSFPLSGSQGKHWIFPDRTTLTHDQIVTNESTLKEAGVGVGMKDRGTGSTLRYQGSKSKEVVDLLQGLYGTNFLKKEDLTILIMPSEGQSIKVDGELRGGERDQFQDNGDMDAYRRIKDYKHIFTKEIIEIENDPTGERNRISTSACVASVLAVLVQQERLHKLCYRRGYETRFFCPIVKALERLEAVGAPGFNNTSRNLREDILRGSKGTWYESGEVAMKLDGDFVHIIIG